MWILNVDIKGVFENINYEYIFIVIGEIFGRELIK